MSKNILVKLLALSIIVVIIIAAFFAFFKDNKNEQEVKTLLQNKEGIKVEVPRANEEVSSPLKISGFIEGNGWVGFEGQVGTVTLLNNEGQVMAATYLPAIENWMKLPVKFKTYLEFISDKEQEGVLLFRNENPSGLEELNKEFSLPVRIKKTEGKLMRVKTYFMNNNLDPEISCDKVFPIERSVPKTEAIARSALQELLNDLNPIEKDAGFYTSINPGVKIQNLNIKNGIAYVDFSKELGEGVAGSCKVLSIRSQITETLKQFPTVKDVVISIDGNSEDILQP